MFDHTATPENKKNLLKEKKLAAPGIILIVFSVIALIVIAIIVSFGTKNFNLLNTSISQVDSATKNKDAFEEINNELLLAENEYRIFLFNHDTAAKAEFTNHIKNIVSSLDLIKNSDDSLLVRNAISDIKNKTALETSLNELKLAADSLLENTSKNIDQPERREPAIKIERMHNDLLKQFYLSSIDTVKMSQTMKRRHQTFFQKVSSLFLNREPGDSVQTQFSKIKGNPAKTSSADSTSVYTDSLINDLSENIKNYYQQSIDKQLAFRTGIAEKEKQLALINISLLDKITSIFKGIQSQDVEQLNDIIAKNKYNIVQSQHNLITISICTLLFLCVVIILLIRNLKRAAQYETDIINARKKAENLSLMKGRFLSNMSHEIRSPLTSIIGFTEQLEKEKKTQTDKEYLSAIQSASNHLLKLVNDILDFSKLEAGKLTIHEEVFSPRETIEEVIYGMQVLAIKKNLQLSMFAKFENDVTVLGDKLRLTQILYNLISNAIKFTNKGRISISASLRETTKDEVSLAIVVEDTGIGIPENQLETIFEEFSQLNIQSSAHETPINRGTGLGLSISKMLVELQHGTITADSTQSVGSTFYVSLPYKLSAKTAVSKKINPLKTTVPSQQMQHSKILIAEDNDLNIMLLSNIFKNNKIDFDIVTDGDEGLRSFENKDYDLVITDIFLPGLSGIDLAKRIRKNSNSNKSHKPVLAFTSNVLKEDIDIYQKAGITDYISKPTTEKDLLEKINKYL